MKYDIAYTGSTGNAVLVDDILFDIGISAKDDKMKELINKCKAIFISHKHSDHINLSTYKYISDFYPLKKVYVNELTKKYIIENSPKYDHTNLITISNKDKIILSDSTEIIVYKTKHEEGVSSLAYLGLTNDFETFIFGTDFYDFKDLPTKNDVGPIDYFFIEANHDKNYAWYLNELNKLNGQQVDSWILKSSGRHTSKEDALKYFTQNKSSNGKFIPLHKSSRFYDMQDYKDKLNELI